MFTKEKLLKALEMALAKPYELTTYPLICKVCGKIYGQTIYGPTMGDCGRHYRMGD